MNFRDRLKLKRLDTEQAIREWWDSASTEERAIAGMYTGVTACYVVVALAIVLALFYRIHR